MANRDVFRELGTDDAVHDPRLYDIINDFDHDIPFWRRWAEAADGPVLELCCGSGRITMPLANAGIPIAGVDHSAKMLAGLHEKATEAGLQIPTLQADMRTFEFRGVFNLIFVPFNSFQNLYGIEDVIACLASIRRHLSQSGRLIIDVFNPSVEFLVDRSRVEHQHEDIEVPGVGTLHWHERCCYDDAHQVNRVCWRFEYPDGHVEVQHLDMRCFYPLELRALLQLAGYEVESCFGDYDNAPFRSGSLKQIVVCTP